MTMTTRQNASVAALAGVLALAFGWGWSTTGLSDSAFYNFTVDAFNWTLRIGGLLLMGIALLCALDRHEGLLLDVFISGTMGAVLVLCGAYWTISALASGGLDPFDVLCAIFGFMFLGAARTCWAAWRVSKASPTPAPGSTPAAAEHPRRVAPRSGPKAPAPPPPAETVHPAAIRPASMPADGSPPPGGYLAALAREQDEPPRASHE